jgi:NADH-quinone oxidoreductase subunit M
VYPLSGILVVCALVIGALFMLRVVQKTCFGETPTHLAALPDVTALQALPRLILASVIVLFGFFPALLFDVIQSASTAFVAGWVQ